MPDLRTLEIRTLHEFTQLVQELMGADTQLWYRGMGRTSYALVPSLYRHPKLSDAPELLKLERRLVQRFRERSIPYEQRPFIQNAEWEYLFLMQHYGVPTRLLDWTENPFIGLYFALTSARVDPATLVADESASVWVLNPGPWNQTSLQDITFPAEILSVPDKALESFEPRDDRSYMRNLPVAIYGLHNSARIVAQRGAFTVFGQSTEPMDAMYRAGDFAADTLVHVEIPPDAIEPLRRALFATGITDSVVYPDLDGLALDIKRHYGFSV